MPMNSTRHNLLREALRVITLKLPSASLGKFYELLAPPPTGIPLAHRYRRALRGIPLSSCRRALQGITLKLPATTC
eukprot:8066839-Pyramimonas_sp.AAC.1